MNAELAQDSACRPLRPADGVKAFVLVDALGRFFKGTPAEASDLHDCFDIACQNEKCVCSTNFMAISI
jgi:hypothetical protein